MGKYDRNSSSGLNPTNLPHMLASVHFFPKLTGTLERNNPPYRHHQLFTSGYISAYRFSLFLHTKLCEAGKKHIITGFQGWLDDLKQRLTISSDWYLGRSRPAWTCSTMPYFVRAIDNSANLMVEMKGRNRNTFADIPILVKGLVFLDNSAVGGLSSEYLSNLQPKNQAQKI